MLRYTYIACFVLVSFSRIPLLRSLFYNLLNFYVILTVHRR